MGVCLGKLSQFRLIIDVWIRHFEATDKFDRIGLDIHDTVNFFQVAPDRGGTSSSHHVGHFERDQREVDGVHARLQLRRIRLRDIRFGRRLATTHSRRQPSGQQQWKHSLHFHSPNSEKPEPSSRVTHVDREIKIGAPGTL